MMNMKILSWNIRGINNEIARANLGDLIKDTKADVICLQETKCDDENRLKKSYPFNTGFYGFVCQPSLGLSGGLVTLWSQNNVKCIALAQSRFWIWVTFSLTSGLGNFHIINVYSPLDLSLKNELWEEIRVCSSLIGSEPLAVVGDFNCIRGANEKCNCVYSRRDMELFDGWIEDCNFLELTLLNTKFT